MPQFHDFLISQELQREAEELGWSTVSVEASVKILEADDRGELTRKIKENREDYDIIAFRGGNHELNRKAFAEPKMDMVLHPGKGRKDSGMNHVDAKKATQNNVAVGFTLKEVPESSKKQSQELNKWRRNLKLCQKYDTPYILTTEAEEFSKLRAPRDIAALISSLGYNGKKAVSNQPEKILEHVTKVQDDQSIGPGHEVAE